MELPPLAKKVALAGFVVLAIGLGTFCPWSGAWWSAVGFRAHGQRNYELAIEAYEMSLLDKPDQTWVLENLVRVQWAVGKKHAAFAALRKIRALDADMARKLEAELINESR